MAASVRFTVEGREEGEEARGATRGRRYGTRRALPRCHQEVKVTFEVVSGRWWLALHTPLLYCTELGYSPLLKLYTAANCCTQLYSKYISFA